MVEKQHISDQRIISCLNLDYGIEVTTLESLSLGADMNASVYKAEASDRKAYFVKLKLGHFQEISLAVLELLQMAGIPQLIPPIKTIRGEQTQQANGFTCIIYPFVQGQDGFNRPLTDGQWITLGKAMRQVHEVGVPLSLKTCLRQEDFSSKWREKVMSFYTHNKPLSSLDEIALKFQNFLYENRSIIQRLVECSEELSQKARSQPLELVLCHSDVHGGNILIDDKEALFIVDWDEPILAPKERDLMFIGGGVGNVWNKPYEEKLFYRGYGKTKVDWILLAYYRYERIVVDIAEYCQELLLQPTIGRDKSEMFEHFMAMFAPHGVVDTAYATEKHLLNQK